MLNPCFYHASSIVFDSFRRRRIIEFRNVFFLTNKQAHTHTHTCTYSQAHSYKLNETREPHGGGFGFLPFTFFRSASACNLFSCFRVSLICSRSNSGEELHFGKSAALHSVHLVVQLISCANDPASHSSSRESSSDEKPDGEMLSDGYE